MARGSDQAKGAATSAQNLSNAAAGNAGAVYSVLAPQLATQMAHPTGFDPTTMARMATSAAETAGGSQAGAAGAGALRAARTRNAGGSDAATAESSRSAGQTLSRGILGTQLANAEAKMKQQSQAEGELGGLYSTSLGQGVNALGQVANNVNADANAQNASWGWAKYILDPMMQAASSSKWIGA